MDSSLLSTYAEPATSAGGIPRENGAALSLCEVCNLQLTSAAQARLHYNGRSHLRRVRQLKASGTGHQASGSTGAAIGDALPEAMCTTGTSSGLLKPFVSFPRASSSPGGPFPNYHLMDPVQKAIINHTFGVTVEPKKKQTISCCVCQLRFNSDSQADAHYRGSRHAKKLRCQDNKIKLTVLRDSNGCSSDAPGPSPPDSELKSSLLPSQSPPSSSLPSPSSKEESTPAALPTSIFSSTSSSPPSAPHIAAAPCEDHPPSAESEEEKAKKLLYCSLCKVAVNSLSQLEAHNAGSKHKTMLDARSGAGPIKAYPRPGAKQKSTNNSVVKGSGLHNKTFHCQICDVHVNSEIQLKQHISSRRHKDRVAGKPSKPKYSPYAKQQRGVASEPVTPQRSSSSTSLLSAPSTPLLPTISLQPYSCSSIRVFTASILQPAPGRIRTSQESILFTPY
ncbi:zinc finger protein 385B [Synchiropus picturatus]